MRRGTNNFLIKNVIFVGLELHSFTSHLLLQLFLSCGSPSAPRILCAGLSQSMRYHPLHKFPGRQIEEGGACISKAVQDNYVEHVQILAGSR